MLVKLGAKPESLSEVEIVITNPDVLFPRKRFVTIYSVSGAKILVGKKVQTVQWAPDACHEMIVEFDSRWTSSLLQQKAQKDWSSMAIELVGIMLQTVITKDAMYSWRLPQDEPKVWSARIRLESRAV